MFFDEVESLMFQFDDLKPKTTIKREDIKSANEKTNLLDYTRVIKDYASRVEEAAQHCLKFTEELGE